MHKLRKFFTLFKSKILIVKIGAIGDVILALSMLKFLKDQNPKVHITWVCGKLPAPILKLTHLVDELIEIDEQKLLKGGFFAKAREVLRCNLKIGVFKRFNRVAIAHRDPRYSLLTLFISGKKRAFSRRQHHSFILEHLRLLSNKDVIPSFPKLYLPFFTKFSDIFQTNKKVIAISAGGAKNVLADDSIRRWPIQNYVKLAEELIKRGYYVILTGGSGDKWVESHFANTTQITSLIGKSSVDELLSIFNKCNLVITHDSGPLYMAFIANAKVIGLFGPLDPTTRVKDLSNVTYLLGGKNLSCAPCYDGKNFSKCSNNLCMQDIKVEEVLAKALTILQN